MTKVIYWCKKIFDVQPLRKINYRTCMQEVPTAVAGISHLPNEILHMILLWIEDVPQLCRLRLVDHRFQALVDAVIIFLLIPLKIDIMGGCRYLGGEQ